MPRKLRLHELSPSPTSAAPRGCRRTAGFGEMMQSPRVYFHWVRATERQRGNGAAREGESEWKIPAALPLRYRSVIGRGNLLSKAQKSQPGGIPLQKPSGYGKPTGTPRGAEQARTGGWVSHRWMSCGWVSHRASKGPEQAGHQVPSKNQGQLVVYNPTQNPPCPKRVIREQTPLIFNRTLGFRHLLQEAALAPSKFRS